MTITTPGVRAVSDDAVSAGDTDSNGNTDVIDLLVGIAPG